MKPLPTHRIAIEPRSGIWLMFYETLITSEYVQPQEDGRYKQQLLRIIKGNKFFAENIANLEKLRRGMNQFSDTIIRDDSERNVMLRKA